MCTHSTRFIFGKWLENENQALSLTRGSGFVSGCTSNRKVSNCTCFSELKANSNSSLSNE